MTPAPASPEDRVLILAPTGKDAALARDVLARAGVAAHPCADLPTLVSELAAGAGAVLLTEEAAGTSPADPLTSWLAAQPPWSDLPVLLLARAGADSPAVARAVSLLGNVTVLERPLRVAALVTTARTALRARRRQYQARQHMAERERAADDLRASEEQLRQSEERAAFVRRASGVGFWYCDLPFDVLRWDHLVKDHFHLPADAHVTIDTFYARIHPADREPTRRAIEHSIRDRAGYDVFYRTVHPHTGAEKWVRAIGRTFYAADGSPVRFDGVTQDATDQRRAEAALRASEERYRTLFESIDEGFCVIEFFDGPHGPLSDYVHVEANPAYERHAGIPNVVGRTVRRMVPDEADGWVKLYRGVLRTGEPIRFERELVATGRHLELSAFRVEPAGRRQVAVLFTDITTRKRAEAALRESEERFRQMADHAPVMVWVTEPDGTCTFLSKTWYEFTGQTPATGLGFGWLDAVHPDDRAEAEALFVAATARREVFRVEYRLRRQDGVYRWAIDAAAPRLGPGGEFLGYIGSVIDITDRKATEEALKEADRRKDEFLATLAHELRNPLAPIRNSLHILRLAGPGPAADRVHDMMERQVSHMVRLVDDLLEVSRITRGKIDLRREAVEVAGVVRTAVETSRPLIDAAGHRLAIALPPAPLTVDGDPVRLAQVLANLLNNAAKYTDPGGQIWLTVRQHGGEVQVAVRDTGSGLPADMLERVFDPFTQVDRTDARAQGGLGIGLTLVKRLAELHGGSVAARSDGPGLGSEFTVTLPLMRKTERGTGNETPDRPAADSDFRVPTPALKRVLVVDDNRDAADSLGTLLSLLGAEVRVAYSGPDALAAAADFRPAVVLLDIGMPGMDGYEVARRLRGASGPDEVTLIALTGWGQEEDRHRTRRAGFDHHLTKPADVDALKTLLLSLDDGPPAG